MLDGFNILIVEDEALVAWDLAWAVEARRGEVIGPVTTVASALSLVDQATIAGAILDANLADRDVTPLALKLIEMDVPFVVHTGTGLPEELAATCPDLPVLRKPTMSDNVLAKLEHVMGTAKH